MRLFGRWLSGLTLLSFLTLVGVQTLHAHPSALTAQDDCQICKIAHQAPSLINPPTVLQAAPVLVRTVLAAASRSTPQRTFHSYGPAPPAA